jgi:ABC-type arginine/histidine transport system permease subunit
MDFSIVWQYLPLLLEGAWVTLWITVVSLVIGLALAIPLALARLAKNPLISSPAYLFVFSWHAVVGANIFDLLRQWPVPYGIDRLRVMGFFP